MKRVFLVHGWGGTPDHGWFPWMKEELERKGFLVIAPQLPETDEPKKELWVPALAAAVATADTDTYFVGHSMGCEAIARYLETLSPGTVVGGVVYVAGFFKRLTNIDSEEVAHSWLSTQPDFAKVRALSPKSIAIFSDNDEYVPLDNVDTFRDLLGSEIIVEHAGDHFNGDKGWTELPVARDALLRLAGE